ncbi:MAG TPA: isopenicillin N synthase family oxygenase [Planctomycetes bacterium]|nr:isopenicillin N synthase family oxygenase [Planctomycetota bacterium]
MSPPRTVRAAPAIPLVDAGALVDARPETLAKIDLAFSEYGILHVSGHGIGEADLAALYRIFAAFCARPEDEKRRIARPDLWYQRGWSPPDTERAIAAGGQGDFKECFFAALDEPAQRDRARFPEIHARNVWPEGLPEFAPALRRVAAALQDLGLAILGACEAALGLGPGAITRLLAGGPHVSRLLRYLPLDDAQLESGVLWGENHTDFCALTLLPGGLFVTPEGDPLGASAPCDPRAGLFLTTRGGDEVPGTAPAGSLVVQVGQQLEILTGGRFLATPHEIRAPRTPSVARLSLAHFMHVATEEVLFPLEPFQSAEAVERYRPPVLAGTYDLTVLADIDLAPPAARERLGYPNQARIASQHDT